MNIKELIGDYGVTPLRSVDGRLIVFNPEQLPDGNWEGVIIGSAKYGWEVGIKEWHSDGSYMKTRTDDRDVAGKWDDHIEGDDPLYTPQINKLISSCVGVQSILDIEDILEEALTLYEMYSEEVYSGNPREDIRECIDKLRRYLE